MTLHHEYPSSPGEHPASAYLGARSCIHCGIPADIPHEGGCPVRLEEEIAALLARAESAERERDDAMSECAAGARLLARATDRLRDLESRAEMADRDGDCLRRALLCEMGDPAGAPEGWTLGGDGSWRHEESGPCRVVSIRVPARHEHHAIRAWRVRTPLGDITGEADGALDAMQAADEAAEGEAK